MSHPLFERHRALLERALEAIAERGYWSAFGESPSPKVYGEGAAEAGKAAFEALAAAALRAAAPGHRRRGRQGAFALRLDAGRDLSPGRSRCPVRGDRAGGRGLARRRSRNLGRRGAGDPHPHQPAQFRNRACRDAHDRSGLRHGLPGRRAARAGPRPGGRRLCVGPDAPHPGRAQPGRSRRARTSR